MGQKIHPYGFRLGVVTDWKSRWYGEKEYAEQANEDSDIRKYLSKELKRGAVSRIDIERISDKKVQIDVHTARPGVVIGRAGSEADRLRRGLEDLTGRSVKFNVIEVQNAELDAQLLARSVADQLEGRVSFRRAMKRTVTTALKAGAQGVRVQCSGRLGGADMGRREWYREGRVPLHTLRADVDYGAATAATTVGSIGVKVWVYKGDILPGVESTQDKIAAEARLAAGGPAKRRAPAKARAEAAVGEGGARRLIEAGGGKRLIEAGGGKRKEGSGRRLIEAGGGKRPSASEARSELEEARAEQALDDASTPDATKAAAEATADEPTTDTPAPAVEAAADAPAADTPAAEEPAEAAAPEAAAPEAAAPEAAAPEAAAAEEASAQDVVAEDVAAEDAGDDGDEVV